MQVLGIGIKRILAAVDRQITCQMAGEKAAERETGQGHQEFFPDGGPESLDHPIHRSISRI